MFVAPGHHDHEVRLTLEALVDLVNALHDPTAHPDVRGLLTEHGFTRAPTASAASVQRVEARLRDLLPALRSLGEHPDMQTTVTWLNQALRTVPFEPWLTAHDGAPLHLHWTRVSSTFDDQVLADVLMALAREVVDHGTSRFGRCAADGCSNLFYDTTRNRSRRFCADPRCASRTHTAEHRARRRSSTS